MERSRRTVRTLPETPCHWARPSRRLHRRARVAPASMPTVTPLASRGKRRAGLGRPVPGRFRSTLVAPANTLSVPASRWSASAIAQAGSSLTPGPGKANDALPAPGWITPRPPQGGLRRPSNITRDYAPSVLLVRRAAGRPARPTPARPHNQRYVKWPQPPSLGASRVCAHPCAHDRPALRRCARAAGASRARSPQPGPDGLMARPPTCQGLVGSSQRKKRAVLRFAQALPPLHECRLRWKTAPCTCAQVSTVLGPSRPSPSGSPLRSEALTGLRAALVGRHVQKAFLGCHQP
jgi:hypothetical protein